MSQDFEEFDERCRIIDPKELVDIEYIEEAERTLGPRLTEMRTRADAGDVPDDAIISEALASALRLAALTKKTAWFAWAFDYARLCKYKLPWSLLNRIYAQVKTSRPAIGPSIDAYSEILDDKEKVFRLRILRKLYTQTPSASDVCENL